MPLHEKRILQVGRRFRPRPAWTGIRGKLGTERLRGFVAGSNYARYCGNMFTSWMKIHLLGD